MPDMKGKIANFAVPMVCFCDIPLGSIREHVDDYGKDGLGLSREWAFRMKLNPVFYMSSDSQPAGYVLGLIQKMQANFLSNAPDIEMLKKFYEVTSFIKPYKGESSKRGGQTKVFYNEREWRYVPYIVDDGTVQYRLSEPDFRDVSKRESANQALVPKYELYFEPKDVIYVLLSQDTEILPLAEFLPTAKWKYSKDQVEVLKTRIQVTDQLLADV